MCPSIVARLIAELDTSERTSPDQEELNKDVGAMAFEDKRLSTLSDVLVLTVPLLVLIAGADRVCVIVAMSAFLRHLKSHDVRRPLLQYLALSIQKSRVKLMLNSTQS